MWPGPRGRPDPGFGGTSETGQGPAVLWKCWESPAPNTHCP